MKKTKKICWSLMVILVIFNYVGLAVGEEMQFGPKEAYILIDYFLRLDPEPTEIKEKLAQYNQWSSVYGKYSQKKLLTKNEMKVYLLIVSIAEEKGVVHTQEEIYKEIVSKFENQPEVFLAVLDELTFFIPVTCKVLKEHFFFVNEPDKRYQFAKKHEKIILQYLGENFGSECMTHIIGKKK